MREVEALVEGWEFSVSDIGLDAACAGGGGWEEVTLPHSWNALDGHTGGNDYHRGGCWYRRPIDVGPIAGRRIFVEFGAAGSVADVYVGATRVGGHRGGYSTFRCDLTDALDDTGRGIVAVRVDNSEFDDVYPLVGDHTVHGGLYRGARLVTVPELHLDLLDHGSAGVRVEQTSLDDDHGVVSVRGRVRNDGDDESAEITVSIVDGDDVVATVSATVDVSAGDVADVDLTVTVDRPHRWNGRHDPHLYRIVVDVGNGADRVELPFGFRTFDVDPDLGVFLNGSPYRMHGVSRHHDFEGRGPALLAEHHERDIALISELGASAVRLAHYQHDQYFYDLCDRAGLLVWAEIPLNAAASARDPLGNAVEQLEDLIAQCHHHPSIVCWGVQNESTLMEGRQDPRPTIAALHELAHDRDDSRPTTHANVGNLADDDPIHRITDLDAVNLYSGWYYDTIDDLGTALDEVHVANPDTPVGLSEYGADAHVAFHSDDPGAGDYTEEYQSLLHESSWRAIEARPFVWSSFVWNMFDFASDRRDEAGHAGRNMKGLVTYDRSIRKDSFYWYQANWSDEPMVHICSKRYANRTESHIPIKVYSNQPEVRLVVDGVDAGRPEVDGRIFRWHIALSAAGTSVRAETTAETADAATFSLVAEPDPTYVSPAPGQFGGGTRLAPANWYDTEDIVVDHSIYSTWTTLEELVANPATREIVVEVVGAEALENDMFEMALGFSFDKLARFMPDTLTDEALRTLHRRLSAIPKP